MNDNWEKEGLKYLDKIFGEVLSLEDLEKNLEKNTNKELMFSFFKNIINFLGISSKLGEELEQNIQLDMSPKKCIETILKVTAQFSKKNPKMVKQIEDVIKNIVQIFQSLDFHKELLSISTGNEFEDLIKKRFLEELDRAEQVNKSAVVKSFKLALNYVERQQQPDQLFILSSYNKLGVQPEKLKTDTILNLITSILEIIFNKKQVLFKLSDDDSIYNLQKIYQNRDFDDFEKGFGYYLSPRRSLRIQHSKNEDYIDYRNAINHINGFDVFINRESEEITMKFYLKRETKGIVYWNKTVEMRLKEFEKLFRDFRKFQNSLFYFYEVYIKSIDKNYQYQFLPFKDFSN
ncbi:hypothetical protein ES703_81309 [subsurface metagenome]